MIAEQVLQTTLKCFCCHKEPISRVSLNQEAIQNQLFLLCSTCCKNNEEVRKYRSDISFIESDVQPVSLFSMNSQKRQSLIQIPESIQRCRSIVYNKYQSLIQSFNRSCQNAFFYLNTIQSTLSRGSSDIYENSLKKPRNKNEAQNEVKQLKWLMENKEKINDTETLNKKIKQLVEKFQNQFSEKMNKIQQQIWQSFESIVCQKMFSNSKESKDTIKNILNDKPKKDDLQKKHQKIHQKQKNPISIHQINKQSQQYLKNQRQLLKQNQLKSLQSLQSIKKSSIIKVNDQSLLRLMKFFDRKIKKLDVVYKASQNDFCMKKYFEKCGHLTDSIIICELWKGKIVGGYTPYSFNPSDKVENVIDQSGSSFVFSLNQNQKFKVNKQKAAIKRFKEKQMISFGDRFLFIRQNNKTFGNQLVFNFNDVNYNNNGLLDLSNKKILTKDLDQVRQKYTGTKQWWVFIKEWEVIKVQFL